jgi:hypothetical protein
MSSRKFDSRLRGISSLACFMTLAAALLSTPGASAAEPEAAEKAEWTVLVFMNGDNNLEEFALADFGEMAKVGSSDKVNVVVQFDRIPGFAVTEPEEKDWTQTLRFLIKKDMEPLEENAVEDIGEANMGDGKVLAGFVEWGRQKYPAKRYMLVIWDHGQGWRFFDTVRLDITAAERDRVVRIRHTQLVSLKAEAKGRGPGRRFGAIENIPLNRSIGEPFRSVSVDETDNDHLFNREIQDALEGLLGRERLDVIGFDACLMGMVETAYALRRTCRVMVGSEELEPGDGWDYSDWVAKLVADPTIDSAALGKVVVESYKSTYGVNSAQTLSAVDLAKIEPLCQAINDLSDRLIAKLDDELANVKSARQACLRYGQSYYLHGIDLDRFCDQLRSATSDATIRDRAQRVRDRLKDIVIHNYAGTQRQGKYGSSGLAIYYPATNVEYVADPDGDAYKESNTVFPVQFVKDHRWDNFMHAYLSNVP